MPHGETLVQSIDRADIVPNVRVYPALVPSSETSSSSDRKWDMLFLAPATKHHERYCKWYKQVFGRKCLAGSYTIGRPFMRNGTVRYEFMVPSTQNQQWVDDIRQGDQWLRHCHSDSNTQMKEAWKVYNHPHVFGFGIVPGLSQFHNRFSPDDLDVVDGDRSLCFSEQQHQPAEMYQCVEWKTPLSFSSDSPTVPVQMLEPVPLETMSISDAVERRHVHDASQYENKLMVRMLLV